MKFFRCSYLWCYVLVFLSCKQVPNENNFSFRSQWNQSTVERQWAGEDYWLNPLQAWRQKEGSLRCEISGGDRNAVLLTRIMDERKGKFVLGVTIEPLPENAESDTNEGNPILPKGLSENGWIGFQLGLKGQFNDYRDDAIKGIGICAGVTTDGNLFIGNVANILGSVGPIKESVRLELTGSSIGENIYELELKCYNNEGGELGKGITKVHDSWLSGLMALTCSQSIPNTIEHTKVRPAYESLKELNKRVGGNTRFSFSDWHVGGDKIKSVPENAFGPILWTQHTLSDNILKMSAQFVPVGNDNREVILMIDGQEESRSLIDDLGRNALFKLKDWDSSKSHSFSVKYTNNDGKNYSYNGIIVTSPDKDNLRIASLSCVDDRGFPHQDLVDNVGSHEVDLYSFHGDQLYERVAGYGVERNSVLDYLRKWYIFGWSFRNLIKDKPAIIIPDDHDVFHGNLWGEGGKKADTKLGYGYDSQDSGGYKEPASFVNMVHRTQTSHLPDAYDPKTVEQGISVYYTNMNYGGVSFAILGDRQWKSAPKPLLPDALIENGWPQNKSWNAKTDAFHPKAELLGPRQEEFLENWVSDWGSDVSFKVVISQSPFCNVATLPADIYHDKFVPGLPRYKKGEYPEDDRPVADFDSNAWPQNKRDKAINIIKKAAALHVTGDQHLGSTGKYGIEEYEDSGYWISTPAVSNLWPRRWFPAQEPEGGRAKDDKRKYTGNYEDGFGNKITVLAVANPYDIEREPEMVFDKAPGYSIIDFNKQTRKIDVSVWPRWASINKPEPDNRPYEGWPIEIDQLDNLGNSLIYELDVLDIKGNDLIKIYEQSTMKLIYALRPGKGKFIPKVPSKELYELHLIADNGSVEIKKNLQPN